MIRASFEIDDEGNALKNVVCDCALIVRKRRLGTCHCGGGGRPTIFACCVLCATTKNWLGFMGWAQGNEKLKEKGMDNRDFW